MTVRLVDNAEVAIATDPNVPGGNSILLIVRGGDIQIEFDETLAGEKGVMMLLSPSEAHKLGGRLRLQAKRLRKQAMN